MLKPGLTSTFILCMMLSSMAQDSTRNTAYDFSINVSGRHLAGQFDQFVFSTRVDAQVSTAKWLLNNSTTYRYNQTGGLVIENNWYQLTSLIYAPTRKFSPIAFYHFDNSLLFRVEQRHLFGAGVGTGKKGSNHNVRIDLGLGYDHTSYNGNRFENTPDTGTIRNRSLAIARIAHQHHLFKGKLTFSNDVFYRHSLEEGSDFMVLARPQLLVEIIKHLRISSSFEYRFENVHLSALSAYNTTLLFGLSYDIHSS